MPGRSIRKAEGVFSPDHESLENYRTPDWFRDAKLGIFIHWGIYSVPAAVNEWYPKHMYMRFRDLFRSYPPDPRVWWSHRKRFGGRKKTGYKDFISRFRGENWDPAGWADMFRRWGARYVVPVGEHHDGFPMYRTGYTRWNAAEMGPKRDICRELRKEVRDRGMKFGISTHRAWNWQYYRFYKGDDTMDPANNGLYGTPHGVKEPESDEFLEDWYGRVTEMIDEFQPEVLYFDFGWHRPRFEPYRTRLAAYYYNKGIEEGFQPVLNYKNLPPPGGSAGFEEGSAVLDIERGISDSIREHPWQTCTSVSYKSWGYIDNDRFRTPEALICDLADIVSKNGNLLINVGPRPDGTIPEEAAAPLNALGKWLKVNGEAVYGTRPWRLSQEGTSGKRGRSFQEKARKFTSADFRFTFRKDAPEGEGQSVLYAIQLAPLDGAEVLIKSVDRSMKIRGVTDPEGCPHRWDLTVRGLRIFPAGSAAGGRARVFRILIGE